MRRTNVLIASVALAGLAACSASTAGIGVGIGGGSGGGGVWVQGSPGDIRRGPPPDKAVTEGDALVVPSSAQLSETMRDWLQAEADLTDLKAVNHGLERNAPGKAMRWRNFDKGRDYALTPGEYTATGDRRCRDFELSMTPDQGPGQTFTGSACRDAGGQWSLTRGS